MKSKLLILTIMSLFVISIANATIDDAVVSHYDFTSNANDVVGNNDFTITGATNIASSINGNAYLFNSTEVDYLTATGTTGLNTNEGTIIFWFNSTSSASGSATVSFGDGGIANYLEIIAKTDNSFQVVLKTGGTARWNIQTPASIFTNDENHQVVVTHDGTETKLYLDGVDITTYNIQTDKTLWLNSIAFTNFEVGTFVSGTYNNMDGVIDEVTYLNRALTPSEVTSIDGEFYPFDAPAPTVNLTDGLVAYYSFDNESYEDDIGVLPINENIAGTTYLPTGKLGGARQFDGVDDYISLDNLLLTQMFPSGKWTLSLWAEVDTQNTDMDIVVSANYGVPQFWGFSTFDKNIRFFANDEGFNRNVIPSPTYVMDENNYEHLVSTFDGTNINLYINGVLNKSVNATGFDLTGFPRLTFGTHNLVNSRFWKGKIDEIGFYDRGINQDEVLALYNSGAGFNPVPASPVNETVNETLEWCYQETTNAFNVKDGSCDLSYDGGYFDASTLPASPIGIRHATLYINYSKPVGANDGSIWTYRVDDVGGVGDIVVNQTLPYDCFIQEPVQLSLGKFQAINTNDGASCFDGTNWLQLANYGDSNPSGTGVTGTTHLFDGNWNTGLAVYDHYWLDSYGGVARNVYFEEAMFWSVNTSVVNNPPVINTKSPEAPIFELNNALINFEVGATDPDGHTLSYVWYAGDVLQVGQNTNQFNHTLPAEEQNYNVTVFVSDGFNQTSWFFDVYTYNLDPVINSKSPVNYYVEELENGEINFSVVASDGDNDVLNYYWSIEGNGQSVTTPYYVINGSGVPLNTNLSLSVDVSDEAGLDSEFWYFQFLEIINNAPTIDSTNPTQTVNLEVGETQTFNITKSDLDNQTLYVAWYVNDTEQIGETNDGFTYTALESQIGTTINISVYVSDGEDIASYDWQLTTLQPTGYQATYGSNDITGMTVDFVGGVGVTWVQVAGLIAVMLIFVGGTTWYMNGKPFKFRS